MDVPVKSDNGYKNPAPDSETNNNPGGSGSIPGQVKSLTPRNSMEDLSEYTDADESISSAPTEFLAEFLSALMMKDYESALKYCKLILQYEPHNATAKEFYPLIQEKLKLMDDQDRSSSHDDSNGNESSDGEEKRSSGSDSEATTASYSSLEDDEADDNAPPSCQTVDSNGNSGTAVLVKNVAPDTMPASLVATGSMKPETFQSTSSDSESPTEPITQPLTESPMVQQVANYV